MAESIVKPVFVMNNQLPAYDKKAYSTAEICSAIERLYGHGSAEAAQRIAGLWWLYVTNNDTRDKLLTEGFSVRGFQVRVEDENPFLVRLPDGVYRERPVTKVIVSNIPYDSPDYDIMAALRALPGVLTRSRLIAERDRDVNGRLTEWMTGRKFVYINVPPDPLPRNVMIGGFKASLYHREQKGLGQSDNTVTCRKCLQKGHRAANCQNPIRCKQCHKDGHRAGDGVCGLTSALSSTLVDSLELTGNNTGTQTSVQTTTQTRVQPAVNTQQSDRGRNTSRTISEKLSALRRRDRSDSVKRARSPHGDTPPKPLDKAARRGGEGEGDLEDEGGGGGQDEWFDTQHEQPGDNG